VDSLAAITASNFIINGSMMPAAIQWGVSYNVSKIQITTAALTAGKINTLAIKNQKSINGIAMNDTSVSFFVNGTVSVQPSSGVPTAYSLEQNYPNPFNPVTVIRYQLPATSQINLKIFDVLGREVTTLVNEQQSAGFHTVSFDASNLQSGVYLYRIQAHAISTVHGNNDFFFQTKRMILLK
jgi:hypothetical protein